MITNRIAGALGVLVLAGCGAPADYDHAPETWYVEAGSSALYVTSPDGYSQWRRVAGQRLTLQIASNGGQGTVSTGDRLDPVDSVELERDWLGFRRSLPDGTFEHWRAHVVDGTLAGRVAHTTTPSPPTYFGYDRIVTGWSASAFPLDGPVSWDVTVDDHVHARLRIDRAPSGWLGRYKEYADDLSTRPADRETLEYDLQDVAFDGATLTYALRDENGDVQTVRAAADGRTITGEVTRDTGVVTLRGERTGVLGYGLVPRSSEARAEWQARTRARIENLTMAGNPPATCISTLGAPQPPVQTPPWFMGDADYQLRDDDAASWPQNYTLQELHLECSLADRWDGASVLREVHGWLAVPLAPRRGRGHPAVVALNGHGGTALDVMTPSTEFWYGDAFARRGYVVLAVDVKHHPDEAIEGEEGSHPPISPDWEEDGERAWDVRHALDWLLERADVDPSRVRLTGLSMGGEVTTFTGALEPRIQEVVPAGWSPDTDLLEQFGSHGCWLSKHANVREYYDTSDLHALVAPRPLLVITGRLDPNYSSRTPTFSHELQVLRRSRVAYVGDDGQIQQYLHDGAHDYRVGGAAESGPGLGVLVTTPAPEPPPSLDWQTNPATRRYAPTLFGALRSLSGGSPRRPPPSWVLEQAVHP